ncbi:hypothetical protein D9M69_706000 [compost metagenome]
MNGRVLANELGVYGVHQERHIVRDDVHDAAIGFVHNPDVGRARDADSSHLAVGFGAGGKDIR